MRITCILLLIFLLTSLLMVLHFEEAFTAAYRPQVSGDLEWGDKIYSEYCNPEEEEEEILDSYSYRRSWLKYKQKLSPHGYYYLKVQYYKKEYRDQVNYNNVTLNFWGNYTCEINEKLRNRWKINIKNKDYWQNQDNSYRSYRLKYQIDYDRDQVNEYNFYIQREWNRYLEEGDNNNTEDKISVEWKRELREDLELEAEFQYKRQLYDFESTRSNKYGREISIGFECEL